MFRAFMLSALMLSVQCLYALPMNENSRANDFKNIRIHSNSCSHGCEVPKQGPPGPRGPRGPRGPSGPGAVASYAFFYTLTEQDVPGRGGENPLFGVVEFDQNQPPGPNPNQVNINQAGIILHTDDNFNTVHAQRITGFEIPETGDYQIIWQVTSKDASQAWGLSDVTNADFTDAASDDETATVTGFTVLDPGSAGTNAEKQTFSNGIYHFEAGTILSIVNIRGNVSQLEATSDVEAGPGIVFASITFLFLGSGDS